MYPYQRTVRHEKSLYKPYITWIFMGYPQESQGWTQQIPLGSTRTWTVIIPQVQLDHPTGPEMGHTKEGASFASSNAPGAR